MSALALRGRRIARTWRLALLVAAIGGASAAEASSTDPNPAVEAPRLSVSRPAGFDSLLQPQDAIVDVYAGGRAIGQARVRYTSGRVTFLDPDALVALLPDLIDPLPVRAALAAPDLDTHAAMICPDDADGNRALCGSYGPGVAGVIFDERRFRIDVFVAPRLLAVHPVAARAYLPRPQAGVSLVDQASGSIAGNGGQASYTVQNRAILAKGEGRIRGDLSYSSTYGVSVDTLVAELDKPGIRYSAGAMWVPGIDLVGRRRLVGIGVQSQVDTRLDRTQLAGTPLVVSLAARSRVDILRDGRLLTSRSYEAGNQSLDTATLPDGAYEVVLHIEDSSGAIRNERRFFTKNAAIAGIGEPIFFAYGGLLGDDRRDAPLATTRTPFYLGGLARRFTPHLALDATVMGTDRTAILEMGGYWLGRAAQVRVAALASVHGDTGVLVEASSSGVSRLNYTIDARRVWSHNDKPLIPLNTSSPRGYDIVPIDRDAELSAGSVAQVNATISYNLKPGQVGFTASYRRDPREGRSYAIGPSLYLPLVERAGIQVNLRSDVTISSQGRSAFVGLSFQRIRARSALTGDIGARTASGPGNGTAITGDIGGSWQRDGVLGGTGSLAAGVEREINGTLVRARGELDAATASIYADVAQPIAGNNGSTQYSLDFQTTAAVTGHGIALQGHERQDSVIRVDVDGTAPGTPFEVLVDNAPRGIVRAGTALTIAVPPYRQYAVRLRSIGAEIMRFDGSARLVSVYPGNVGRLAWSAQRVVAMFGRIVWPDGRPLANAAVRVPGAIGGTDDNGYFQIEAATEAVLKVQSEDGRSCAVALHAHSGAAGYAALGTLTCPRALPTTQIAIATQ